MQALFFGVSRRPKSGRNQVGISAWNQRGISLESARNQRPESAPKKALRSAYAHNTRVWRLFGEWGDFSEFRGFSLTSTLVSALAVFLTTLCQICQVFFWRVGASLTFRGNYGMSHYVHPWLVAIFKKDSSTYLTTLCCCVILMGKTDIPKETRGYTYDYYFRAKQLHHPTRVQHN